MKIATINQPTNQSINSASLKRNGRNNFNQNLLNINQTADTVSFCGRKELFTPITQIIEKHNLGKMEQFYLNLLGVKDVVEIESFMRETKLLNALDDNYDKVCYNNGGSFTGTIMDKYGNTGAIYKNSNNICTFKLGKDAVEITLLDPKYEVYYDITPKSKHMSIREPEKGFFGSDRYNGYLYPDGSEKIDINNLSKDEIRTIINNDAIYNDFFNSESAFTTVENPFEKKGVIFNQIMGLMKQL